MLWLTQMATSLSVCAPRPSPLLNTTGRPFLRPPRLSTANRFSVSWKVNTSHKKWSSYLKCAVGDIPIGGVSMDEMGDEACELVRGTEIVVGEKQVAVRAYLLEAVKNNNGAGVILLSDVFGFEDSCTRDFAYRIACSGYNVLIPDLFRGSAWKSDSGNRSEFERWSASQPADRVAEDIALSVQWMIGELTAAGMPKKLGILGFCFGGYHLLRTLVADHEEHICTGICFYGTNLDASLASLIRVPILFISGDNDPLCPIGIQQEMEKNVAGSRLVVYRDRGNGFAHRPQSQEEDEDAEKCFMIARHWLNDFLLVNKDLNDRLEDQ